MALQQIQDEYRTLPAIIEAISRQPSGGVVNIDSKFNPLFLKQMVIQGRAELAKTFYTGNRSIAQNHFIPDIYRQTFELVYDPLRQDKSSCWNIFECPDFIALDNESSGLRYAG